MDQKSCIEYLGLSKGRAPTLRKIRSDGIRTYNEARYVIVLDEYGNVVEKINRSLTSRCDILVVLAPIVYKKQKINKSVVLEIGFSQTTPYKRIERNTDYEKINISYRRPVAKLTEEKLISLLPEFANTIQAIVDKDISHRKNHLFYTKMTNSGGLAKYGKIRLTGKFITISLTDPILIYICLAKDLKSREKGHLSDFVRITKDDLSNLKFAYYPKNQIKRFKLVKKIAIVLKKANYPLHFIEIIRKLFGKETSKYRALFEQIIDEFNIKFKKPNEVDIILEMLQPVWKSREKELLDKFSLSVAIHPKREERKNKKAKERGHTKLMHAKGCVRVEVFPSKEALDTKNPIGLDGVRIKNLSEKFMNRPKEERRRSSF